MQQQENSHVMVPEKYFVSQQFCLQL